MPAIMLVTVASAIDFETAAILAEVATIIATLVVALVLLCLPERIRVRMASIAMTHFSLLVAIILFVCCSLLMPSLQPDVRDLAFFALLHPVSSRMSSRQRRAFVICSRSISLLLQPHMAPSYIEARAILLVSFIRYAIVWGICVLTRYLLRLMGRQLRAHGITDRCKGSQLYLTTWPCMCV